MSVLRILVIDDGPEERVAVVNMLQREGYIVEVVGMARAAAHLLAAARRPDVVLLDMSRSSAQAGRLLAVLQRAPELNGLPVIGMSPLAPMPLLAGLYGVPWIAKPLVADELDAAIHRARRTGAVTSRLIPVSL